jgi:hypothetical protein
VTPAIYDKASINQKIQIASALQSLKASRQIAFQAHVALDERDEDIRKIYEEAEALYARMAELVGGVPEPVFDERTYVPNPDRWG